MNDWSFSFQSFSRSQDLKTDVEQNCTRVTEFILLGFDGTPGQQYPLFAMFFVIYFITLAGNLGIIMLIKSSSHLHTPMYFFLSNLAAVDICYSSVITPRTLMNLVTVSRSISFNACFAQLYLFVTWVSTECFLLAAMAYDRYMAICNPLLYAVIMSQTVCTSLVAGTYVIGFSIATTGISFLSRLPYCDSNIIRHFFCDSPPLLALSSDSHVAEMVVACLATLNCIGSLFIILCSYLLILNTILRIRSAEGRHKAFSTCSSHLTAITIFYGTLIYTYLRPNTSYSLGQDHVAAVFYTVVVPMLNPLIYSLRNKEVKEAFKQSLRTKLFLK